MKQQHAWLSTAAIWAVLAAVILTQPPQCCTAAVSGGESIEGSLQTEYLKVSGNVFAHSLTSTISDIRKVMSVVSRFATMFDDFRLSNAISDCLDLLDLSSDELSLVLSASQSSGSKGNGTGNIAVDLKTWLTAAFGNQDTCMDGFEGTSYSFVKDIVAGSMKQVTSLVGQALSMVDVPTNQRKPRPAAATRSGRGSSGARGSGSKPPTGAGRGRMLTSDALEPSSFPSWISPRDRKLLRTDNVIPDVVVAADGSGNFSKIMDAVEAAPAHSTQRFVIYIKKGVYDENVEIKRKKTNIMMYGDGIDATVITGNRSTVDGWTTYRSATFAVTGAGFIGRDLTIQNTAGPEKHQAVAFRSDSDLSALYRCAFKGYQDTLYPHSNRQFFRECTISGTVDFIFGDAVAVFQRCRILARKGLDNQKNTITAQGRKDPNQVSGFSIQFCNVSADWDLLQAIRGNSSNNTNTVETYLGRPWKPYSRTVIMESYLDDVVNPKGWLEWNGNMSLDTLFYAEYGNSGPGASLGSRVKWPGYHIFNSSDQALNFTVAQFIEGDSWLPSTGVTYNAGLTV